MDIRKIIAETLKEHIGENKPERMENDAMGYNIGQYLYHATPTRNTAEIKRNGLKPKDGKDIRGNYFENRLYLATSLIAAYDISVNFGSYKDDQEYDIFKIKASCINQDEYEEDNLFQHGIFIEYPISKDCIVSVISADSLFDKFDEDDIDNLYA